MRLGTLPPSTAFLEQLSSRSIDFVKKSPFLPGNIIQFKMWSDLRYRDSEMEPMAVHINNDG